MAERDGNSGREHKGDDRVAEAEPFVVKVVTPKSLAHIGIYGLWGPGGPGRLLSRLARDHASGEATLRPEELADLVELFKNEALPESLRQTVVLHLRGKRIRRQGAPKARQTGVELVELMMLPGVYAAAVEQAKADRDRLKQEAQTQRRRDPFPARVPPAGDLACDYVRKCLPTLKDLKNGRLKNLVSELKDASKKKPRRSIPRKVPAAS